MLFCSDHDPDLRIRRQIERERRLGHGVVPLAHRLAAKVPEGDVIDLLEYLEGRRIEPAEVGHDLARLFGDDGEAWYDLAVASFGTAPHPPWASFRRERAASDMLLVDLMDDARAAGCEFSALGTAELERLTDLGEAKRAADAAEEEAKFQEAAALYDQWWLSTPAGQAVKRADEEAEQRAAKFKSDMQAGGFPMLVPSAPSAGGMPLMAGTAAAVDLGRPIVDGFLAGQQGRPADEAPSVPATVPLAESLNLAIGHVIATAERSAQSFRAGAVVDALAVLAFLHEETAKAVVARVRGLGCALPESKLAAAVRAFEVRISREVRAGSGYITNAKGEPDQNSDNVAVFLRLAGVEARFNAWRQRGETRWSDGEWTPLTDAELNRLRSIASQNEHRFRPSKEWFRDMLADLARQNSFDPVLNRLDAAERDWDGQRRLAIWLSRACGVPCDLYHQAVGRNIMGGIVRRGRHAGCKHDTVAIFKGAQGCGKSTLTKILALDHEWHTDSIAFEGRPQDLIPQMAGRLVIELSELDGLHRRDVGFIKRFLSTTTDNVTLKYDALASDRARRCVFIGTCNLENPLVDDTGNRRFYPVSIPEGVQIDTGWLAENIEQLIGEAATLESAGEKFEIPREVWGDAAERQEAARNISAVEEMLLQWFTRADALGSAGFYILSSDVVSALTMAGQNANAKVGSVMHRLGYVQKRPYVNGVQLRAWIKSPDGEIANCARLVPAQNAAGGRVEMRATAGR